MKTTLFLLALAITVWAQDGPEVEPGEPTHEMGYAFSAEEPIWKLIAPFRIPGPPRQNIEDVSLLWVVYLKDTNGILDIYGALAYNYFNIEKFQVVAMMSLNEEGTDPLIVQGVNQTVQPGSVLQFQFTTQVQEDGSVDFFWGIYQTNSFSRFMYPLSIMRLVNLPLEALPQFEQAALVQIETDKSRSGIAATLKKHFAKKASLPEIVESFKTKSGVKVSVQSLSMSKDLRDNFEVVNRAPQRKSVKPRLPTARKLHQFLPQFAPNLPPQFNLPSINPSFLPPPERLPGLVPRLVNPAQFSPRSPDFFPPAFRPPRIPGFGPLVFPVIAPFLEPPQAPAKCAFYPQQPVVFNDMQVFGQSGNPLALKMGEYNDGLLPDDGCTSLSATEVTTPANAYKISFIYDDGQNSGPPVPPTVATSPLQEGCCGSDADCGGQGGTIAKFTCVFTGTTGTGVCKGLPRATIPGVSLCWSKADCPATTPNCQGATVCPCGQRCFSPDIPGRCSV